MGCTVTCSCYVKKTYFNFILQHFFHFHKNGPLTSKFYEASPLEIVNGLRFVSWLSVLVQTI